MTPQQLADLVDELNEAIEDRFPSEVDHPCELPQPHFEAQWFSTISAISLPEQCFWNNMDDSEDPKEVNFEWMRKRVVEYALGLLKVFDT